MSVYNAFRPPIHRKGGINVSAKFRVVETFDGYYLKILGKVDLNMLSKDLQRRKLDIDISRILREVVNAKEGQEILLVEKKEDLSAPVLIAIAPGKMSVVMTLNIKPGTKIPLDEVFQILKDQQIIHGINLERIKTLLNLKRPAYREVIAKGDLPENGADAQIEYLCEEPILQPIPDKDDFAYRTGGLILVQQGDVLARRTPATIGAFGCNVLGEIIHPRAGRNVDFNTGTNVRIDTNQAIAAIDGALHWEDGVLSVVEVTSLSGSSVKGEHTSSGKVLVTGDLSPESYIIAKDDIEIRGNVTGSTIISEKGSVFIKGGIIGNGQNIIQAAGNVEAQYCTASVLEVGRNLIIEEFIHASTLSVGKEAYCRALKEYPISEKTKPKHRKSADQSEISQESLGKTATEIKDLELEMKSLVDRLKILAAKPTSDGEVVDTLRRYTELSAKFDQLRQYHQDMINRRRDNSPGLLSLLLGPKLAYKVRYEKLPLDRLTKRSVVFFDHRKNRLMVL